MLWEYAPPRLEELVIDRLHLGIAMPAHEMMKSSFEAARPRRQ
jgi:hypothetical protein